MTGAPTTVPIREYLDREIAHVDQEQRRAEIAHQELHVNLQRAIDKGEEQQVEMVKTALEAINKRLEGMNEFRSSLEDVTRSSVSRDLFDVVTNRVTIVENTYVRKEDLAKDTDALRDRHSQDLAQRDSRLDALERTSVRQEEMTRQEAEVIRTRKALTLTIIAGAALMVTNLLINVIQTGGTGVG